jgi:predicted dehydrogenase
MQVKWGVIGACGIADRRTIPEGIIPAKNAQLVALMDIDEERLKKVAEKYGGVPYYTKENDLINDPQVEALYIATPTYLHHSQTLKAARAGKHILCEKPMAMNLNQAEEMIRVCEENKVKLTLGYMMRYHSHHRRIKELIDEEALGTLIMGRAQLTCWYPPMEGVWRQRPELGGGGSLIDMGTHCIDLLEMFMGKVVEVFSYTGHLVQDYPVEDTAAVLLKFKSGAVGVVDNHFNIPDASSENRLEIYGSRGSILARGTIGQDSSGWMVGRIEKEVAGYQAAQRREEVREEEIKVEQVNIYQAEIEDFSGCILRDTEPSFPPELGLRNLKIALCAYESARKRKPVRL